MRRICKIMLGVAGCLTASAAARAECTLNRLAELQVRMVGLRPLVAAKINGTDAMFLVDSGAFFSIITSANAARFGLHTSALPGWFRLRGVTGDADASLATVKAFGLAGATFPGVEFIVGGGELSSEAAGVIGQNFLRIADVEYDLANGAIRLMKPKGCERAMLAYWAKPDAPISIVPIGSTDARAPFTIAAAMVNGAKIRVVFDSGAPTSIMTMSAARRAGIRIGGLGVESAGMTGGFGKRMVRSWIAPIDSFEIGGEKVLRTRLRIGEIELGNADMLLGDDFFLSNRIYVANSQHKMYFTYNGGPLFNLSKGLKIAEMPGALAAQGIAVVAAGTPPALPAGEPNDADGFSRRGTALLARGDVAQAMSDLTRAIELAPNDPRYPFERAQAHSRARQPFLAMTDVDAALKLKPDYPEARLMRAALRLQGHDKAGAHEDVDAAVKVLPKQADMRFGAGQLYLGADAFEPAIEQFGIWIAAHGEDSKYPIALNARCWARALGGVGLDQGVQDCDRAVQRSGRSSNSLDSRGLMYLRRGNFDRAIADYDAALAKTPKMAWSLYGRGIAKVRKGLKTEGEADIVSATKIAPAVPERAKVLGITP